MKPTDADIERALRDLGKDSKPDPKWQDRVWAEIDGKAQAERQRTQTIVGMPPPLHLPADREETTLDLAPAHVSDDAVVVDIEVNAAGQIEIVGAERGS